MFQVTNISLYILACHTTEMCIFSTLRLCTVHNKMFLLLVKRLKLKSLFLKEAHFLLSCIVIKKTPEISETGTVYFTTMKKQ